MHIVTSSITRRVLVISLIGSIPPSLAATPSLRSALGWLWTTHVPSAYPEYEHVPPEDEVLAAWIERCRRSGDVTDGDADHLLQRLDAEWDQFSYE